MEDALERRCRETAFIKMKLAYQIAVFCGAFPMACGTSLFALARTRWDWLMTAGLLTIFGGVAVFFVGTIALAHYRWLALRSPEMTPRRLRFRTLAAVGLLQSNFPLAVGYAAAAIAIDRCYTVVVHNASRQPLHHVQVVGGGCRRGFRHDPVWRISSEERSGFDEKENLNFSPTSVVQDTQ